MTEAVENQVEEQAQPEENLVNLTIDNIEVSVPEGTVLVDAAKRAGIDIPVFCYHPKMEPVGMCRMCLVEVGRPMRDRATGDPVLEEDGSPKIQFGPKLDTGCTVEVSEGMVVRGYTEEVVDARKEVLEFLLTSHPLDCPICDKGGECPLQNLTMQYGPGTSRFVFDEKHHADKHVPLGEIIYLDRERCIQCARCTRFQDEVVDDPVIGFSQRGRNLEIVTFSDPGFDSYWSGNTTDICPVGALTTADFRFGARPWELKASASVCNHCPVGCNTTVNTRREAKSGGDLVIKRMMPRQNELVNEIWMCDKGRFAHHYTQSEERLTQPMARNEVGDLEPVTWEAALDLVAEKFKAAGDGLVTLAGARLSNEDLFNIQQLTEKLGGKALQNTHMAGGELLASVGVGQGTNLADLGEGDAILVVASDLEEEAPLYWLRVKQASERGATLVVANPRDTKLSSKADFELRYSYGEEAAAVMALLGSISPKTPGESEAVKKLSRGQEVKDAGTAISEANNLVVFYGSEGTGLAASQSLADACANLLVATGHVGKANNGLIAVWDKGNTQGAYDMGLSPSEDLATDLTSAKAAYIVAADPAGDDAALADAIKAVEEDAEKFVVVQELFLTETAKLADVVLPVQANTERQGTYTNAERRVQIFYPAVPAPVNAHADYAVAANIADRLDLELEKVIPAQVMAQIAATVSDYADVSYTKMAEVEEQWPIISSEDVFYGGTSYENEQGMGQQLQPASQRGESPALSFAQSADAPKADGLLAVPVTRLYDRGSTIVPTELLSERLVPTSVVLNPADAEKLGVEPDAQVGVKLNGSSTKAQARIEAGVPQGYVLVPRSVGIALDAPAVVEVEA